MYELGDYGGIWTGMWTKLWTGIWTDALVVDNHFQLLTIVQSTHYYRDLRGIDAELKFTHAEITDHQSNA